MTKDLQFMQVYLAKQHVYAESLKKSKLSEEELNTEYILPYAWDERAHASVAKHVSEAAVATKVNKIKVD